MGVLEGVEAEGVLPLLRITAAPHLQRQRVWDLPPGVGHDVHVLFQAPVYALDRLLPAAVAVCIHETAHHK